MASILKIKRSTGSSAPNQLAQAELAYSWDQSGSYANGKLWIGTGDETAGAAANIHVIGGKYFTDMLDHTRGVLTASSALLVDADSKLDNLKVDNLDLNGNTITATDTNGSVVLAPNGTGSVDVSGKKITNLATPTAANDAVTKAYADALRTGLDVKQSVRAATTANITLSGTQTIDGIALSVGDRVLVKNQTTASQNGIYVVASGAWTRATDADEDAEVTSGLFTYVESGTSNQSTTYVLTTTGTITLGTTALSFSTFSAPGSFVAGSGLTQDGSTFNVGAGTGLVANSDDIALTGQALALHNLATNGLFVRTGAGTVAARSVAVTGTGISVTNGDGVSGNPTLGLSDALASVGGLTPASDRLAYYTGTATAALATLTSFARSLLDDADAAAARTTLALGSIATQAANNVNITGGTIDGITLDGGTF